MSLKVYTARHVRQHGLPCGVAVVLAKLPPAERDELLEMMADQSRWPNTAIAEGLQDYAKEVGDPVFGVHQDSIRRHRIGRCRCNNEPQG